ncbi:MAG TPA: hypothetical protein VGJ53_11335 [Micromonosporaceae bacterium]
MRVTSRVAQLGVAGLTATLATFAVAAPAFAAPPANDTFAGAVAIGALPFTATQDTSEATTDADDTQANEACGAPALDASVWYTVTPATDQAVLVDVSQSNYSAGVLVVTGTPGTFELVTCGPGAVAFEAFSGTAYHLLIIDDQLDGTGNGGTLNLSVSEAPPPPVVDVTVNPTARFDPRTGSATVSGMISCVGQVDFAFLDVELRQQVGRFVVFGVGSMEVACDGVSRPWSVEIFPDFGGKFAGGKAASVTFAVACGPVFCGFDFEERIVKLSRR